MAMIISCPSCSARYKIDDGKIKGRGAKITCPRCGHKFVVYKEGDEGDAADAEILEFDFRAYGVTWMVRKGVGITHEFHTLASILEALDDGKIDQRDSLSYDGRTWVPIDTIDDLGEYFREVQGKAERGEVRRAEEAPKPPPAQEEDEDEADAPTTIMRHGSSLMDDIRRAVNDAQSTPTPAAGRRSAVSRARAHQMRDSGTPVSVGDRPSYIAEEPEPDPHNEQVVVGTEDPFSKLGDGKKERKKKGGSSAGLILTLLLVITLLVVISGIAAIAMGWLEIPGLEVPGVGDDTEEGADPDIGVQPDEGIGAQPDGGIGAQPDAGAPPDGGIGAQPDAGSPPPASDDPPKRTTPRTTDELPALDEAGLEDLPPVEPRTTGEGDSDSQP